MVTVFHLNDSNRLDLQQVLNAAARLISCTSKYDRGLSALYTSR